MNSANYTGNFNGLRKSESEIKSRWGNLTFCIAYLFGYPATALANGFSDYLVKPFLPDDFYKIIYAEVQVDN